MHVNLYFIGKFMLILLEVLVFFLFDMKFLVLITGNLRFQRVRQRPYDNTLARKRGKQ